jgi:predicted transcriptional regulator
MKVLLSIKPEFADRIFDGTKRYEYRRMIFKQPVDRVVVYASAPVSKVIGEFEMGGLLYHDLPTLWYKTSRYSGISEQYFYLYFSNKRRGYAIQIGQTRRYRRPLMIQETYGINPPQSYAYIERGLTQRAAEFASPLRGSQIG